MNTVTATAKPVRPIWIIASWLGIALFSGVQYVLLFRAEKRENYSEIRLFFMLFLSWFIWELATPLVLRLGRRYPPLRLRPVNTWIVHGSAFAVIGLISAAWEVFLEIWMNPFHKPLPENAFRSMLVSTIYDEVLVYISIYAALLAISYIISSRERLIRQQIETAHLNEQFSRARLDALRRQIEPHFLFNALHAIAGLVRENQNDAAVTMIAQLSDFLRKVVDTSDRQEVPLGEEVQFLQKYLDIQKVRFAERLNLSVDVPPQLLEAQVPSLILQPIVENAIKHGISKEARGGWIRVSAQQANGHLTLRVYNDGPGLPPDNGHSGSGIGLANLRTRLSTMFGDAYELTMKSQDSGVEVLVSVPYRVT